MNSHFKFISDVDVLPYLLKGVVKFTPIQELNDPSELIANVIVDEVKKSLLRLRRDGYTEDELAILQRQGKLLLRLSPGSLAVNVPKTRAEANALIHSTFYDDVDRLERLLNKTAQEFSAKVGLFCLSLRYNSLPMWAHYASNARGFVIEFRNLDDVFPGDETGILRQIIPIRYEAVRLGVTFEPQSHESLFLSKFDDWKYEQEARVVLPRNECKQITFSDKTLYIYEIPQSYVARVILGWNMSPDKVKAVTEYVNSINSKVEIVQARFLRDKVILE